MGTHKTDENMPDCELYNHNKSIFVASNVKDIMLRISLNISVF